MYINVQISLKCFLNTIIIHSFRILFLPPMTLSMFTWKHTFLRYYYFLDIDSIYILAVQIPIYRSRKLRASLKCCTSLVDSTNKFFIQSFFLQKSINNRFVMFFQVSKIDDISLTMTFELYMDLM